MRFPNYAIDRYNMHIVIGVYSLPGSVNNLGIEEAFGYDAWFFNTTNVHYSFRAIDAMLNFIKTSDVSNYSSRPFVHFTGVGRSWLTREFHLLLGSMAIIARGLGLNEVIRVYIIDTWVVHHTQ